ncbi:unnamed protein product, partial [Prorocentrum cordatum]
STAFFASAPGFGQPHRAGPREFGGNAAGWRSRSQRKRRPEDGAPSSPWKRRGPAANPCGCSPPARQATAEGHPAATSTTPQSAAPEQVPRPRATEDLDIVTVTLQKDEGSVLGIDVGNVGGDYCGAVVLTMSGKGLVADWNSQNPTKQVCVGHIIIEANGVRGYWELLDELTKPGRHTVRILRALPHENWQHLISCLAQAFQRDGASDVLGLPLLACVMVDSTCENTSLQVQDFTCLPSVLACDVDVDQCCICLERLKPTARLVQPMGPWGHRGGHLRRALAVAERPPHLPALHTTRFRVQRSRLARSQGPPPLPQVERWWRICPRGSATQAEHAEGPRGFAGSALCAGPPLGAPGGGGGAGRSAQTQETRAGLRAFLLLLCSLPAPVVVPPHGGSVARLVPGLSPVGAVPPRCVLVSWLPLFVLSLSLSLSQGYSAPCPPPPPPCLPAPPRLEPFVFPRALGSWIAASREGAMEYSAVPALNQHAVHSPLPYVAYPGDGLCADPTRPRICNVCFLFCSARLIRPRSELKTPYGTRESRSSCLVSATTGVSIMPCFADGRGTPDLATASGNTFPFFSAARQSH